MSSEDNQALSNEKKQEGGVVAMNNNNNKNENLNEEEFNELRQWNFNILKICQLQNKFRFALGMFVDCDLYNLLNCNSNTFMNFLNSLSQKYDYRNNPFHNFNHGITVAHGIYFIIKEGMTNKYLDKTEQFTLLFSALCHDVDHTGHSNAYETNSKSLLYEKYGSESPLEKHHVAETLRIADECKLFENIPQQQLIVIKKFVTSNILATDMQKHNQIMNEFKQNLPILMSADQSTITEEQKINLCGALVHASDIGAPTRDFSISKEWSLRIAKEQSRQFELEQQNNIPVTAFYKDLDKFAILAKNEIGFISFFIKPFWDHIESFGQGKLCTVSKNIDNNICSWTKEREQEEQKLQQAVSTC